MKPGGCSACKNEARRIIILHTLHFILYTSSFILALAALRARGQLLVRVFKRLARGVVIEDEVYLLQAAARLEVIEHLLEHDARALLHGEARHAGADGGESDAP